MSIVYNEVAGYGVRIDGNLTDEAQELLDDKYDGEIESFLEEQFKGEFNYESAGNQISGIPEYYIICEDPLKDNNYKKLEENIEMNKDKFLNSEIKWICEICIW